MQEMSQNILYLSL